MVDKKTDTDKDVEKLILSLPAVERGVFLEFLGASPKSTTDVETLKDSLSTSINFRAIRSSKRPN